MPERSRSSMEELVETLIWTVAASSEVGHVMILCQRESDFDLSYFTRSSLGDGLQAIGENIVNMRNGLTISKSYGKAYPEAGSGPWNLEHRVLVIFMDELGASLAAA